MGKDKDLILARKNLANSSVWKEIKLELFEIIKEKGSSISADGNYIKGMLKTIDIVDKWINEYNELLKFEERKGV